MAASWTKPPALAIDPTKTYDITMETTKGTIELRLDAEHAPNTVNNFVFLAREGFYDGVSFHRVIKNFMIQGGDPTGTGTGNGPRQLKAEFNPAVKHMKGTLSAARTQDPNSASCQFFIMHDKAPHLDGQYTIWGQVTEGMEHIDAIKRGAGGSGMVSNPDKIVSMKVAADA